MPNGKDKSKEILCVHKILHRFNLLFYYIRCYGYILFS